MNKTKFKYFSKPFHKRSLLAKSDYMKPLEINIAKKTPCLLEPRKLQITAQTDKPLNEIIPILYLAIPHSQYAKAFGSVTFLLEGKLVTVYSSGNINLGCVLREEIALELLEKLRALLDKAFEYYEKHGPPDPQLLDIRQKLSPLEIYKYLPKTNCKECGEQGCFPFAVKLANGEKTLQDCPQIKSPKYSSSKIYLEKMLQPIKLEANA
jgi:ArsR family metal-binding transcriptional regulator